jgi:hypothetical protein
MEIILFGWILGNRILSVEGGLKYVISSLFAGFIMRSVDYLDYNDES